LSEGPRTYRTVFELRYERAATAARRVAEALMKIWDGLHAASDPLEYVKRWRRFRENLSRVLAVQLKIGDIAPGEILVDIPPAGKDQIRGVYVIVGGRARAIQDV